MRKIRSAIEIERIRRRNHIILGVIMIALLTASSLGYSLMSADKENKNISEENGFEFIRDSGLWKVIIDNKAFGFQNLPSEIQDINVNTTVQLGEYSGQPLYFVSPGEGANEILMNIKDYILRYQETCLNTSNLTLNDYECNNNNLPTKSCYDGSNLIVFSVANETRVYEEGNCVFITGDVLKGSDAFLYKILGIN